MNRRFAYVIFIAAFFVSLGTMMYTFSRNYGPVAALFLIFLLFAIGLVLIPCVCRRGRL